MECGSAGLWAGGGAAPWEIQPGCEEFGLRGETLGKKTGIIRVLCEGAITRVVIWNRTETGYQQKLFKLQQNLNKCRKKLALPVSCEIK